MNFTTSKASNMNFRSLIFLFAFTLFSSWALAAPAAMPVVTQKTVNDYWVEQQQTGTFAGIGRAYTLTQQHGEIFHTFEMVIDATGRPTKYRLISIKPNRP